MIKQRSLAWQILSLLIVGGCGGTEKDAGNAVTVKLPGVKDAAAGPKDRMRRSDLPAVASDESKSMLKSVEADPLQSSRYTSLEPASCNLLEGNASKDASERHRCAGPAGYALEAMQSDVRQDLAIISPDGSRSELNLPKLVTNATFGKTAEWRGPPSGQPRALIVRINDATNKQGPKKPSNLIVARLATPACVVAVIPRGPRQNEQARAVADRKLLKCRKG